jgi:diguanylate cyclase (GGDEF)-like protein
LERKWDGILSVLDYALQPIVNIHTGYCYGYEALLRNVEAAGFSAIGHLFDQAERDGVLAHVDQRLLHDAIVKFSRLEWASKSKLFYNLDNRVFSHGNARWLPDCLLQGPLAHFKDCVCLEISERHELHNLLHMKGALGDFRAKGLRLAIDDFGTGYSGLQLLYLTQPDFIKIDRFFIQDIATDVKKRMFAETIIKMSHMTDSLVIAEGIETPAEYYCCRALGCDLAQGYLIQRPTRDTTSLMPSYDSVKHLAESDRRDRCSQDYALIRNEINFIEPIRHDRSLLELFDRFQQDQSATFIPVVDDNGEPLGIVREKSIKEYAYSRIRRTLLENPAFRLTVKEVTSRFPVADINSPLETILEIYSLNEGIEGILISSDMHYKGFLSAHAILKTLNEKNLAVARDQNPLTRLAGNTRVFEYVSRALQQVGTRYCLVYFDFDHFKAYNDTYGFRHGDRAILLFADILKARCHSAAYFVGHIGGDDFFLGVEGIDLRSVLTTVAAVAEKFRRDVESFYDPDAIRCGYIDAKDRNGVPARFPLMTVSAVVLEFPALVARQSSADEIANLIAELKKEAKGLPGKIRAARALFPRTLCSAGAADLPGDGACSGLAIERLPVPPGSAVSPGSEAISRRVDGSTPVRDAAQVFPLPPGIAAGARTPPPAAATANRTASRHAARAASAPAAIPAEPHPGNTPPCLEGTQNVSA